MGKILPLLHTLHLEAQPIPNILSSFQGIKRLVGIVEGEDSLINSVIRSPKAKIGRPTQPDSLATWDPLIWASWLRCRRSFFPKLPLDLKPTIKIVPRRFPEGSATETQKHRNRDLELQIRGGKLRRDAAGVVSITPTTSPPSP